MNHNTVNLPESATVEDIEQVYLEGWKLRLKALAVYRDNCKVGQPLSIAKKAEAKAVEPVVQVIEVPRLKRRRLPNQRPSTTTRFTVGGAKGYMTASSYPEDGLGEVFLKMSKQGSTLAGVMDAFSVAISVGLQHGVPLDTFVSKFINMRFEPAGMTDDPDVRMAASVVDYIFRRLALDHLPYDERAALGVFSAAERAAQQRGEDPGAPQEVIIDTAALAQSAPIEEKPEERTPGDRPAATATPAEPPSRRNGSAPALESHQGRTADAPLCLTCGTKMRPAGSCYVCEGCGSTSGCS
jgi:ribonucleoside-diphosphate reductase alpha chain